MAISSATRKNVLVISAHADDEILGCGATMAKHVLAGDRVSILVLSESVSSRLVRPKTLNLNSPVIKFIREEADARRNAAKIAASIIGATNIQQLEFADQQLDRYPLLEIAQVCDSAIVNCEANVVYTHFPGDLNRDHRIVSEAVTVACRVRPGYTWRVEQLLFFEVPSSTEQQVASAAQPFVPNWFEDVSGEPLFRKLQALEAYASEMRDWPHPRSISAVDNLARWRGATVGVEAAEGFVLGRYLGQELPPRVINDESPPSSSLTEAQPVAL